MLEIVMSRAKEEAFLAAYMALLMRKKTDVPKIWIRQEDHPPENLNVHLPYTYAVWCWGIYDWLYVGCQYNSQKTSDWRVHSSASSAACHGIHRYPDPLQNATGVHLNSIDSEAVIYILSRSTTHLASKLDQNYSVQEQRLSDVLFYRFWPFFTKRHTFEIMAFKARF